jgi:DNA-binding NarL/FixJ family response regulator
MSAAGSLTPRAITGGDCERNIFVAGRHVGAPMRSEGQMTGSTVCPPIRVLVADDHEIVRAGISRLLDGAEEIDVVGVACDGAEAVDRCEDLDPDVVLMDLQMPGTDGITAIRELRRGRRRARVVVLTSFSEPRRITDAIDAGAVGYLLKDAEPAELLAGIRAAADGGSPLAPRVAVTLVAERRQGSAGAPEPAADQDRDREAISDREREVLALVGAGVANKQIAFRLGISPKTVKSHLSHIFRQIGVNDRLQAALWARRHGLVDEADVRRIGS